MKNIKKDINQGIKKIVKMELIILKLTKNIFNLKRMVRRVEVLPSQISLCNPKLDRFLIKIKEKKSKTNYKKCKHRKW